MFLQGTIYVVIYQNNSNLWGKMPADVEMDADFDATSLNVSLMFLSGAFCALIGQFMTSTEEAQEDGDDVCCRRLSRVWQDNNVILNVPVRVYDKAAQANIRLCVYVWAGQIKEPLEVGMSISHWQSWQWCRIAAHNVPDDHTHTVTLEYSCQKQTCLKHKWHMSVYISTPFTHI